MAMPDTIKNEDTMAPEVIEFLQQIAAHEALKQTLHAAGQPALQRLVNIAQNDTGQAVTVRRLLLGLYNGYRFPFDLTRLRGLDSALYDDCMAVIAMDARAPLKEIHEYIQNGSALFETWAQEERQ
jgi:hypothetical protein